MGSTRGVCCMEEGARPHGMASFLLTIELPLSLLCRLGERDRSIDEEEEELENP